MALETETRGASPPGLDECRSDGEASGAAATSAGALDTPSIAGFPPVSIPLVDSVRIALYAVENAIGCAEDSHVPPNVRAVHVWSWLRWARTNLYHALGEVPTDEQRC